MINIKTHRCEKSLKAGVSIRYTYSSDFLRSKDDYETWRLFTYSFDSEYDVFYPVHVGEIGYCPFCGEELI